MRGAWRLYREQFWPILNPSEFRWALLVGTDHATGMLANQIQTSRELPYRVRGLLGHGRRRGRLAAGPDPDPGPAGRRPRSRRRLRREHRAGHGRHAGRLALAEPDGRLQAIGAGTEDHPSHRGPPGRRPPHPHPRHRNQRPLAPRPGAVGHEHHRPPDRRPQGDGHRGRRQHRLGNLPAVAPLQSAHAGAGRPRREPHLQHRARSCGRSAPPTALQPCIADVTDEARDAADLRRSSVRRSCSTPPPTSTCR